MNIHCRQKQNQIFFSTTGIKPTSYTFPKPSHTVTEFLLMLACLAPGKTTLDNTALEPEIDDLILMLNHMGAKIERDLSDPKKITIHGVPGLHSVSHQVISDRNEAVTFACAALATKGKVNILHLNPKHIQAFLNIIGQMGAQVQTGTNEISVSWTQPLKAVNVETQPEPGFMTDWQAVFTVLLTQAIGTSCISERVWPYRFHHIPILLQMGAKIKLFNPQISHPGQYYFFNPSSDQPGYFHAAKIHGPSRLNPTQITINDLRAGACITLAALTAPGTSTIKGVEYIQRGYENLPQRLCSLGADIQYIKSKK